MTETETLPEFPDDIREKVDDLLRKAGEHNRAEQFDLVEKYGQAAWDALPEPKLGWNFYSNIMPRNRMLFFRDTKQFDKCLHWLEITRESYGPGRDRVIEFYAATIYHEMGDFDRAFEEFDRQYRELKTRPFQGSDKRYLEFYLNRRDREKLAKDTKGN